VIVDPSLSTDPRLAANSKAAKVASDGTLQTTGAGGALLNVNLSAIGSTSTAGGRVNATLVDAGGNTLKTVTDSGGGNPMLAAAPQVRWVTSATGGSPSAWAYNPSDGALAQYQTLSGNGVLGYGPMSIGSTYSSVFAQNQNVGAPIAVSAQGGVLQAGLLQSASTSVATTTATIGSTVSKNDANSVAALYTQTVGTAPNGRTLAGVSDGTNSYLTAVQLGQFTNNSTTSSVSYVPMEAVSSSFEDNKGNVFAGFGCPVIGVTDIKNTSGLLNLSTSAGNANVNVEQIDSAPISGSVLPVTISSSVVLPVNLSQVNGTGSVLSGGNVPIYVTDQAFANTAVFTAAGSVQVHTSSSSSDGTAKSLRPSERQTMRDIPKRTASADSKLRFRGDTTIWITKWKCPKCVDVYDYGEKKEGCKCLVCGSPMIAEQTSLDKIAVKRLTDQDAAIKKLMASADKDVPTK